MITAGCTQQDTPPTINAAMNSDIDITYSGSTYNCSINYIDPQTASITINSPETLKGMKFTRSDSGITLSLGSLQCKSNFKLTSDSSFIPTVLDILDNADSAIFSQKKGDLYEFTVHTKNGDFKIYTDSQGNVTHEIHNV